MQTNDFYLIEIMMWNKCLLLLDRNTWSHTKKKVSKVGNLSQGWPEGSLYNSYYTKV